MKKSTKQATKSQVTAEKVGSAKISTLQPSRPKKLAAFARANNKRFFVGCLLVIVLSVALLTATTLVNKSDNETLNTAQEQQEFEAVNSEISKLFDNQKFEEVIEKANVYLAEEHTAINLHNVGFMKGVSHFALGQVNEAEQTLLTAADLLEPQDVTLGVLETLAYVYEAKNNKALAADYYQKAAERIEYTEDLQDDLYKNNYLRRAEELRGQQ